MYLIPLNYLKTYPGHKCYLSADLTIPSQYSQTATTTPFLGAQQWGVEASFKCVVRSKEKLLLYQGYLWMVEYMKHLCGLHRMFQHITVDGHHDWADSNVSSPRADAYLFNCFPVGVRSLDMHAIFPCHGFVMTNCIWLFFFEDSTLKWNHAAHTL